MNSVGQGRKERRGSHRLGCTWRCRLFLDLGTCLMLPWGKGGPVGRMLLKVKASPFPAPPPIFLPWETQDSHLAAGTHRLGGSRFW